MEMQTMVREAWEALGMPDLEPAPYSDYGGEPWWCLGLPGTGGNRDREWVVQIGAGNDGWLYANHPGPFGPAEEQAMRGSMVGLNAANPHCYGWGWGWAYRADAKGLADLAADVAGTRSRLGR